jgi:hypothetical protein
VSATVPLFLTPMEPVVDVGEDVVRVPLETGSRSHVDDEQKLAGDQPEHSARVQSSIHKKISRRKVEIERQKREELRWWRFYSPGRAVGIGFRRALDEVHRGRFVSPVEQSPRILRCQEA